MAPSRRVCLGRIADAHGVRGLVKILPYGERAELLESLEIYPEGKGGAALGIALLNPLGRYILARIKGVEDRDAALALRGTELWAERASLPDPGEDEYYIEDLKGLKARSGQGEDMGAVLSVQDFGASPLLEIRPPAGPSYYLPFTRECVPEVRVGEGYIVIDPPAGLAD